jgi:succinoglycan biosynthesis transport protein ExoP
MWWFELKRRFAPGLSTARDVQKWAGIACLGLIPTLEQRGLVEPNSPSVQLVGEPGSPFALAFQKLWASLLASSPGRDVRVVALTSALPDDGKTTCSLSLARQSALEGFRTVLVDCDLRRGSITAALPRLPAAGLLELIEGACSLEEALIKDELTELCILPVLRDPDAIGRAAEQDVYASSGMRTVISALRGRFDYIFIDTAPVLAVVETRRLVPLVDTFVFLTRWRRTPRHAVKLALNQLREANADLAGLVLTRTPALAAL